MIPSPGSRARCRYTAGRASHPVTVSRGPCLIVEDQTATSVSAKFDVHVDARGYLVLERNAAPRRTGGTP